MPVSYQFTEKQKAELEAARKENKNKRVDKRLEVLLLRAAGVKRAEVAKKTDCSVVTDNRIDIELPQQRAVSDC